MSNGKDVPFSMDTASFFQTLFSGYPDPGLRLELRCLPPMWDRKRERPWPRRWYALGKDYLANAATFAQFLSRDWDVYYGVLPRLGPAGGQASLTSARVLWCDVDGGEDGPERAEALLLQAALPLPHLLVSSGGGYHAYWMLSDTVDLTTDEAKETFKRTLKRLCRAIGGTPPGAHADPASADAARVLRVPGTINHKRRESPRAAELVYARMEFARWHYDGWRGRLPIEPPVTRPAERRNGRPDAYTQAGFIAPWLQRLAERGYPEGKRHQDLAGFGAWVVRTLGVGKADARFLMRTCADHSPGLRRITDDEIDEILRWC